MCGRFSLLQSPEEVEAFFALDGLEAFPPRYNIAPTQPILTVTAAPPREPGSNRPDREAHLARWGLLPSWVKDPKDFPLLINARSETAAEKASFRAAMRHRRALIPASGFYEWKRDKATGRSQAYWIRPADGGVVAFGGLAETWMSPDGSELDTAAILTTASSPAIAFIHDRMPVTIMPEDFSRWLDCRTLEPRDVADLLAARAGRILRGHSGVRQGQQGRQHDARRAGPRRAERLCRARRRGQTGRDRRTADAGNRPRAAR